MVETPSPIIPDPCDLSWFLFFQFCMFLSRCFLAMVATPTSVGLRDCGPGEGCSGITTTNDLLRLPPPPLTTSLLVSRYCRLRPFGHLAGIQGNRGTPARNTEDKTVGPRQPREQGVSPSASQPGYVTRIVGVWTRGFC